MTAKMSSDPRAAVSAAIQASGLSIAEWARTVVGRDERTVRRWLAGEPIPAQVADWVGRLEAQAVAADAVIVTVRR